ncbi:sensor histidine kinase [Edaphobacter bradus]|uniref:sensor histidine kinase n=1 Tax=Edaphobacter bradus TaxID=2259016 RepID=UPI0021E0109E|nr:ATP-binding protein [Edaphobacter bradus]
MAASENRRKLLSIALGTCLLVVFAALATLNAFNKRFLDPDTTGEIFVYTGLSVVAFLLFVAVLVLLVRNVLKLYADQRSRVMGTRLRTRMLWGAVLVSLLPLAFMFAFSYLLMNRAVDRWFSQPVTEMRDSSNRMAFELSRYTAANARAEAESIAMSFPDFGGAAGPVTQKDRNRIEAVLRQHEITLQGGFAAVYQDRGEVASFQMPRRDGTKTQVKSWLPEANSGEDSEGAAAPAHDNRVVGEPTDAAILTTAQRSDEPVFSVGDTDYALGLATAKPGVTVVVGVPMPRGMAETMTNLRKAADAYWTLFRSRRQLRNLYMLLLLMMTGLALFSTSWLALHLSKQVTKPVESLADAMEAIAAGDYGHRVKESATEELGELVRSFNHMAADLEGSRRAVEASTVQLSAANTALEARRSELETMLETIPNGVATLDQNRRIILANRALGEMLDPGGQRPFLGLMMEVAFPVELAEVLDRLIGRSHRMGSASSEIEMTSGSDRFGGTLNLLATVALLETPASNEGMRREHRGYVIVLENATELLRAQKQSAWKEVARRVAHEIKNPLTPIGLSAEQIRRHIDRLSETLGFHQIESPSPVVIRRCSEVISSSVETMRALVDQFSALAEFPTARPRPADLNTIAENSLAMFAGRLQNIRIVRKMATNLPLVMADPEALKRALGNLIDNAAEAMQNSLLRELRIETSLLDNGMVELTVADTGSGLTDAMKERLFLPYFSTKQRGTGLGLAIAAKIVQEHQGTIRAEKNVPAGAKFIIELRPASAMDSDSEAGAVGMSASDGGGVA